MSPRFHALAGLLLLAAAPGVARPQSATIPPDSAGAAASAPAMSYADAADLLLGAPMVAVATVRSTARLKGADAVGVPPGLTRFYVEADVEALIRGGTGGVPPRVGYLLDLAPDADGRLPKLRRARVLLFARPVPGTPGQLQLAGPRGQTAWDPATEALVRRIATELVAADAPPAITGVGGAFHVPGALPGEGETQIFLKTANASPATLSILRRPGERPRWAVALSEVVDDAAQPPARDTLLWYRLACGLPSALPASSTATLSDVDAQAAREDYRLVLAGLGPCGRTAPAASAGGGPA